MSKGAVDVVCAEFNEELLLLLLFSESFSTFVIVRWREEGGEVCSDLFLCARDRFFILLFRNRFDLEREESALCVPDGNRCSCLVALRDESLLNPLGFLFVSRISGSRVATPFEGLLTPPWGGILGGIVVTFLCLNQLGFVERMKSVLGKLPIGSAFLPFQEYMKLIVPIQHERHR